MVIRPNIFDYMFSKRALVATVVTLAVACAPVVNETFISSSDTTSESPLVSSVNYAEDFLSVFELRHTYPDNQPYYRYTTSKSYVILSDLGNVEHLRFYKDIEGTSEIITKSIKMPTKDKDFIRVYMFDESYHMYHLVFETNFSL